MDIQEIRQTPIWTLFEKGRNYHRLTGIYRDTDRNYNFFNGDQWLGAKLGDVEPLQLNFIKSIVKYKLAVIHDNLYSIVYSSQNFEDRKFQREAGKYCDMLNRYASRVWEKDKLDFKGRRVTKDAAINDEGLIYVNFNPDDMMPVNEIIKKSDVYFGNENNDDIQSQPYILIRKRMPVVNARDLARGEGLSEEKLKFIVGDNDTFEESGEAAKEEVDDQVTLVYKFYKHKGTVHFSISSRWVDIVQDTDIGIKLYPLAHMVWEEKEGSARGEGEVRYLIPNQIEVNRTLMRRALTVKLQAYPHKVVDTAKVQNPQKLMTVGGLIQTNGQPVDDVHKVVATIPPAQMSPDVKQLQEDLVQLTRDLAGAGDTATGQVNPESASGRAILAVQQASQAPMTEQRETYKAFLEDIARIWLEYLIAYSEESGARLEQVDTDPATGEDIVTVIVVPQKILVQLQASVKIDVTPKGVYDRFAQEQTIENLFLKGYFNPQKVGELEIYEKVLPDDSVAPKQRIKEAIKYIRDEQRRIQLVQQKAALMQQRFQQFIMKDPGGQAQEIADAQSRIMQNQQVN